MSHPSIPRLTAQSAMTSQKPLTLREGQMFHGQIKQLFPGQMAEVQIGGQKLMAKLEVPMKAGDAYYFQVKSTEPELQLKVVSGPLQESVGQSKQLLNLMESMQLPKSQEMQSLLNHFMKQKLPISREILLEAEQLLKTVPSALRNEALNSLQKLVEMKLPLNDVNFKSLIGVEAKEGLHTVIDTFKAALGSDEGVQPQLKDAILKTLAEMGKSMTSTSERMLFSGAMQKLLDDNAPQMERFHVLQLMKNSGILPSTSSLANLQHVLHSSLVEQSSSTALVSSPEVRPATMTLESWQDVLKAVVNAKSEVAAARLDQMKISVQNDPVIQQQFKSQLIGLLNEMEKLPLSEMRFSTISEQISKLLFRAVTDQSNSMQAKTEAAFTMMRVLQLENADAKLPELFRTMEQSQLPAVKELVQASQMAVEQAIDGKVMKEAMQTLFKVLGMNYEAGLLHREADFSKTAEMLKPQLVALLHDSSISPAVKEAAEMVVARMNGSMLHSTETGMNQQIVMQLPLELLGKRIDATLQWNGRMKDDGKIDPDYARILFYLDLESINKTVVDMQVQNRVIAVTIYNENEMLKDVGNRLQDKLKKGLEALDYKLSGISFKNFLEEEKGLKQPKLMTDHQGVDFRI